MLQSIPNDDSSNSTSSSSPSRQQATFIKSKRGHLQLIHRHAKFRNSLLAGAGYLELANAGDFAANIWNEIPVPRFAMVLMAIGGTIALLMTIFAVWDFYLSWKNVRLLCAERRELKARLIGPNSRQLRCRLSVNKRELGTEIIDRVLMDGLLGFGALLVGTGTLMAMRGDNHRIYVASNLLSGFLGNSFAAVFGVVNAIWSAYLVYRFEQRYRACMSESAVSVFQERLRMRFRRLQCHAFVNGVNGLIAGAANLATAKRWWGYVILIPCVTILIASNFFWRKKLGYDRVVRCEDYHQHQEISSSKEDGSGGDDETEKKNEKEEEEDIFNTLTATAILHKTLRKTIETGTVDSLIMFIMQSDMFESFCGWLVKSWPESRVFNMPTTATHISIIPYDLLSGSESERARLLCECRRFLKDVGNRVFEHRERYLLELVGEMILGDSLAKHL